MSENISLNKISVRSVDMFSVLNVVQPKKSIFGKRKCSVEMVLSPVRGAAPYKIINVTPGKKGIDWRMVAQAAGASGKSMLVPESLEIPHGVGLEKFEPRVLPGVILLNTIAAMVSKEPVESILIVDRSGYLADYVKRIVAGISKITVVTDTPEKYIGVSVEIMEEYGASIRVCNETADDERFDIALSDEVVSGASLCFSPSKVSENDGIDMVIKDYRHLCDENINPFMFVCALFECSGLKEPGKLTLNG